MNGYGQRLPGTSGTGKAGRAGCPVCGDPTGDCHVGDNTGLRRTFSDWSDDPDQVDPAAAVAPHDLYEDVPVAKARGRHATRRVLIARAGQKITAGQAARAGLEL